MTNMISNLPFFHKKREDFTRQKLTSQDGILPKSHGFFPQVDIALLWTRSVRQGYDKQLWRQRDEGKRSYWRFSAATSFLGMVGTNLALEVRTAEQGFCVKSEKGEDFKIQNNNRP
jgi:hypothetical protein